MLFQKKSPPPPTERIRNSRGWGSSKAPPPKKKKKKKKKYKVKYEAYLEFPDGWGGGGVFDKIPSVREVGIFSGAAQCGKFLIFLYCNVIQEVLYKLLAVVIFLIFLFQAKKLYIIHPFLTAAFINKLIH